MKTHPFSRKSGFTLVELLVVIAIIAVIVAISVGSISKFRNSADKLNTAGSLRQMQMANISYAADHNGSYLAVYSTNDKGQIAMWPQNGEFLAALFGAEYAYKSNGDVNFQLPNGFLDKGYAKANPNWATTFWGGSYGYNENSEKEVTKVAWGTKNSYGGTRVAQIKYPARTAAFALSNDWMFKYEGRLEYVNNPQQKQDGTAKLLFKYGNKVPVVYYDGHVEFISPQQIKKYDTQGGNKHAFWNGAAGI